jgi:hypothetical protein
MITRVRRPAVPGVVAALLLLALAATAHAQGQAQTQNTFRLKPGATGQVCFDCHTDFADKL